MSLARSAFLTDVGNIYDASSLDEVSAGDVNATPRPGVIVLRRGILIAALIALETFIRDRTAELLLSMGNWPARFEDLPQRFRDAAILESLSNLQSYARVLKRQQQNYESEILSEVKKMASSEGPVFGFSKFISGDYTGNISDSNIQDLLKKFQIEDCWRSLREFSSDVGFGVPSIQQVLVNIIQKRHRSAHSSAFIPTPSDIRDLDTNMTCLALCFDAALSGSIRNALHNWRAWSSGETNWRDATEIYFAQPHGTKYRVVKHNATRAIAVVDRLELAQLHLPTRTAAKNYLLITRDVNNIPKKWNIFTP